VGCQMTGGFDLWSKLTWGFGPGKREGTLGDSGLPKGALASFVPHPFCELEDGAEAMQPAAETHRRRCRAACNLSDRQSGTMDG
jgi:hypothetical protein